MDGRGAGSSIMLGSAPSGPSFLVSPSVKLSVVGRGGAGKGGSYVLILELVVMAKFGASGSRVSLLLIVESIWEYCSRNSLRCWTSISPIPFATSERKGHRRCLPRISIPARPAFPLREKWKNLNLDVSLVAPSACMLSTMLK
ncbi:hypothetical protein Tco_0273547 [Tanacetum coccineum]